MTTNTQPTIENVSTANTAPNKKFLTIDEAATFLGCSKSLLYQLTSKREIPFYKPTRTVLFDVEELCAWVRNCRVSTNDEIKSTTYIYHKKHNK